MGAGVEGALSELAMVLLSSLLYLLGFLCSVLYGASPLGAPLIEPGLEGWCEATFCTDI